MPAGKGGLKCPACSARYTFRPEHAGRKVRCRNCKAVLVMPRDAAGNLELEGPPPATDTPVEDSYELDTSDAGAASTPAPQPTGQAGKCPNCNTRLKPGAIICMNCGFHLAEGRTIQTQVESSPAARVAPMLDAKHHRETEGGKNWAITEVYVPVACVVVGLLLMVANAFLWNASKSSDLFKFLMSSTQLAVMVPFLALGVLFNVRVLDNDFSPFLTSCLKLLAVAVFMRGFDDTVGNILNALTDGMGGLAWPLRFAAVLPVFWGLVATLLDAEALEALVLFLATYFAPAVVGFFLATTIFVALQ